MVFLVSDVAIIAQFFGRISFFLTGVNFLEWLSSFFDFTVAGLRQISVTLPHFILLMAVNKLFLLALGDMNEINF